LILLHRLQKCIQYFKYFFQNHFSRVNLEPLSADDLRSIIRVKFPSLALYSAAILQTYASLALPTELLQTLSQMESTFAEDALPPSTSMLGGSHRLLLGTRRWTTRDLFKWCFRVAVIFAEQGKNLGSGGISLEEYIFAEALDCFAAPIPCARTRALLLHWLAGVWNLPSDRVEYYAKLYRPTIQVTNQLVSIGRVSLPRNEKLSTQLASTVYGGGSGFSHTTHSSRLLERLAVGIARNEPLLLVGETGNGKTTIIQHLAQQCGRRLLVQNLNQQTDSSDFLGGFKPVELRAACIPLMNAFGQLFPKTFSVAANSALAGSIKAAFDQKQWASLVVQMRRVIAMVDERFNSKDAATVSEPVANKRSLSGDDAASKRNISSALMDSWKQFSHTLSSFERQLEHLKSSFAFSFVEGTLVKAMREGCWLLLDEVNLATSETLERLSGVLDGANGSLVLLERGDTEALPRHPDFRLLASMNPPTDFGKKDLPPGIRNKMTELYVDEVRDRADLCVIVNAALRDCLAALSNKVVSVDDIVSLYLDCITAARGQLVDGSDQRPHYSVRSLTRALDYCRTHAAVYGFQRSLYEGFSLAFLMPLGLASRTAVETLMQNYILKGKSPKLLDQLPREPQNVDQLVQISSHWVKRGPESIKPGRKDFIMTPSITARVTDMARMLVAGKYPVLLQGPTSAGKTSVVVHLAQLTGHRCVRINNHEHTDLQEYMGAYVTGTDGKLRFQEGVLVEAVRNGYWIVLDELNLAPSEVLEALNRLLDDNRELFIPETQETVKPHPHFMLFATQNPPGLYGGRKVLSRAFRNRFIEMHVADIPEDELVQILHERCELAPKFCTAMVKVMKELQLRRQQSQVFAGKSGFITPRDLFRWGARCPTTEQELAEVFDDLISFSVFVFFSSFVSIQAGLMLLGERLRTDAEKEAVRAALSKHIKTTRNLSDEVALYHDRVPVEQLEALIATAIANGDESVRGLGEISWTPSMRRLYALLDASLRHQEPVLLVGETGCGKTTICQVLALLRAQQLHVLNCHQNTETSDFLGSLRPVRGKHQIQIEFRQRVLELFQAIDRARQAFVAHDMQVDSEASSSLWSFSGTVSCASLLDADGLEVEDIVPILHSVINQVTLACSSSDAVLQAMLSQTLELCPSQPEGQSLIESASNQLSSSLSINDAEPAEDKKARKQRLRREKLAALANERSVEEGGAAAPTSAVQTEQADESIEMESTNQQPAPAPLAFSEHACLSSNDISADTLRVLPVPALRILLNIFGLRARSRALFEWADGALVSAMRSGQMLLIDEISLADDAVLERLNSVLEPSRTLLLAEKGGDTAEEIVAASSFRVLATMNPGGDYGKKELSPALRNRFTEIWVAPISSRQDLLKIVSDRCANDGLRALAPAALDFVEWFNDLLGKKKILSVRDILSWVSFMNACFSVDDAAHGHSHTGSSRVSAAEAFVHGACMVLLDGLSIGTTESEQSASLLRTKCVQQLLRCLPVSAQSELSGRVGDDGLIMSVPVAPVDPTLFGVWPFFMRRGSKPASKVTFSMKAPSTGKNFMRVLRALQLPKAILLEGSPGVGKTSLITALAAASGHTVVRINLSEHTDMMDLLGSDMPVAGGRPGEFTWCDGVFLQALKAGSWVLLDELNLASQSVLEGLNAVLDHRASVYLPELDRTFACPSSFRVFAAQNPVAQGGGRKGLPRSFLNRFAKVYLEPLDGDDLRFIMCALHPQLHTGVIDRMVRFNQAIFVDTMVNRLYGRLGSPWEFNLRDMFRWCELMMTALSGVQSERSQSLQCESAFVTDEGAQLQACAAHVDLLYLQRMRAAEDRIKLAERFTSIFGFDPRVDSRAHVRLTARTLQIGHAWLQRRMGCDTFSTASARRDGALASVSTQSLHVLQSSRLPLEHLMVCVRQKWPVALMGPSGSGKTSLVRLLAQVCGKTLFELPMTAGADSTELLGCFEQVDVMRKQRETLNRLGALVEVISQRLLLLSSFNSVALSLDPCVASAAELIKLWSLVNQASTAVWDHSQNSVALSLLSAADRAVHTLLASENTHEIGDLQSNIIPNLKRDLESLLTLHRDGTLGRFEWLDGALVRALEHGHWVLLDQANLANASVLDRLNPLLEPDGVLMINECGIQGPDGQVRIVKPHPDFRLFLALDTSYGEVSRAMRNRCVEINLLPVTSNEIANQLSAFVPASLTIGDVELLINKFSGISSRKLAALLIQVHCEVGKAILQSKSVPFNTDEDCLHLAPVKRLLNWAALMSEQLHRGSDYYSSLRTSMEQAYSGVIRSAQLDDIFHAIYSRFNTNDIAASTSVDVSTAALILAGAKNIQPSEVARDALLPKRLSAFQNLSWMFSNQVSVLADSAVRASGSLLATVSFDSSLIEFLTYSCISYHVCAVYEAGLLDLQTLRNAVQRSQFNADSGESCSASDLLDLQVLRSLPDHIVSAVMGSTSQSLKLSSVQWKSDSTLALQHMKMALQLCANFVEQSSQSDLRVRAKLLSLLIEICNRVSQFTGSPLPWIASFLARTLHTLEALTESPVMRACVLVQTRVGELLNEPTLSLETLNLESNTPLWQYLSANASSHDQSSSESVSQLLQTWQMLQPVLTLQRARIARAFAESQTFTRALGQNSMLSRSAWSPLQQSAACHFGQLDKGRASHPFLSQFVSWITAMDDLIHRRLFLSTNTSIDQLVIRFNSSSLKDDIARISAWFVARDRCWDAVHGHSAFDDAVLEERSVISRRADVPVGDHSNTSLAIDLVHVRWRALSKRTRVLLQLLAASTSIEESNLHIHAVNLQSKLDSSLSAELSSLAAKDTLWKHGGHPFVPRSRQLGHVYSSLKQLDAYALQHSAADNPIKATDLAWKRILLDAFCHTRIAHEHHDRDAADALQSELESVPASLSERSAWVDRVKTAYAHMDRIEVQLAADEHAAKEFDDSDEDVDHDLDSDVEDDDPAKGVKMLNVSALIRRDEPIDLVLEPLQPLFSLSVVRSEFGLLARLNAALGSYRTLLASVAPEHTASFVRNPLRAAQLVGSSRMQAACSHWVAAVSTLPSQMHQIVNFAVHRLQHRRLQALSAYKNLAWRLESVVTQVGSVLDIIAQSSEVAMLEIDSVLSAWHSLMIHDFPSMLLDLQHAWLSDIVIVANSNSPTHVSSTVLHTASNLLSSAKSAWILSYLSKSKHTPIESRRTHRRGLRALVFHLCSNSSQQSEGDELAIAASLSGVLHSFAKAFPQESSCSFASVSLLCTQWTCVFGGPSVLPPSMLTAAALEAQLPIALAVLNACTDVRLQPLCPSLLSSMVRTLTAAATRKAENPVAPDFHSQLGCSLLWTQLGLLRAHLLTPARPFDPALKYQARSSDAASEQNDIGFELAARRWLAALTLGTLPLEPVAGDYESCQVANLQRQARALTETQNELAQHVTERAQLNTVTRRFAELFDETRYFTSAVADIQKVMGVARKLAKLASEQHDHAGSFDEKTLTANASLRSEEKLFQETAARFISRLTLQYGAMYEDFVAPLVGAVQQIQMGLQRLAAATAAPMSTNVETALLSLLEYPLSLRATRPDEPLLQHTLLPPLRALLQSNTLTDVDQLNVAIAELLQQSSATSSRFDIRSARLNLLRSVLARIQRLCSIAGDRPAPALLVLLDAIFQTLASTWRAARDEKARLAAEAEVLYKNRAVVSESETPEQMEQRKLKEMFPDFTSDFEDILMQDSAYRHQKEQELEQKAAEAKLQGLPAPAVQLNHQSMSITDDDVFELYRSYYAVYSSLGRSSVLSSGNDAWVEESAELSAQLIGAASDTLQQSLSACLDQSAAVQLTQLWLLARAHKQLDAAYRIEVGSNRSRAKKIQARAAAVLKEKKQKHKAIKKAQDELVADDAMMEEIQVIQLSDLAADAASTGGAIATASASFSSLATQFSLAAFPAIPSLHVHSTSSTFATSDLFRESNLGEVKLLEAPVRFLLERLRALLIDFPAHPILLQLVQLAQRLASLPVSIPLMKAVQGIELMLQKSEEWEAYASRQVSMRPQLKQLALLVARWRKIELNTWPQALLACERKFHARTLQLFFPLFALVMVKSLPKASESDTEATFSSKFESYLTELHSGLEQFVQSCSVGEFGTRLELLFALQSQLDIEIAAGIAASDSNTDDRLTLAARSRMSRTLFNVRMYYAQFLPLIQAHLASRRAPIAQKLSETAKLFSWDLSNYHSLRDSSEKSHLKVCKLAQEWEDVISSPVINILSTEEKKDAAPEPGSSGAVDDHVSFGMAEREVPSKPTAGAEFSQFVVALPSVESCFTKLSSDEWFNNSSVVASSEESLQSRLPSLLQRMRVLMQRGALSDSAVQSHTVVSSHVENMATTIIQRTQSLRGDVRIS
jgi:MoxR-like ATPase